MTLRGLMELQRKLRALPGKARQRIREAMANGAGEIVDMAKALVPVDKGDLKDSIGWTWGRAPKGSITIGTVKETGGDLTITIYAGSDEAFYARWVEFGTKPHSVAQGADLSRNKRQDEPDYHPGMSAQPFFYVSYRANRKRVKSRITRAINRAAKEIAAGG
ncbi:HK97-gp10 family putative phage morphogenesis protein [Sinorhizobium meliloti]|uniref:HK97-gp10 family putative phage morphogenesis protein n=1 Tax=Rhizobium meliloti TaxID=382 RepID=UPI000FDA15A1|nr:HK97-gp10 family putative phage morphogenesis protein [Sinorhizobium meliloti]MDW9781814.1 HK97 gp10 family phage protein [Sinorhizobium meliloti]RVM82612.1 HK97 gp10 family phage protein [Sinorhizobium meliloti]